MDRYTAQAHTTCGGRAGSCGFENIDSAQYAKWGVDYLSASLLAKNIHSAFSAAAARAVAYMH
jgi:hypothetical protein